MFKLLFTILMVNLFFLLSPIQGWKKEKLKGAVKSVKIINNPVANFGIHTKISNISNFKEQYFDSDGNMIMEKEYNNDTLTDYIKYVFKNDSIFEYHWNPTVVKPYLFIIMKVNPINNILLYTKVFYPNSDSIQDVITNKLDSLNRVIEIKSVSYPYLEGVSQPNMSKIEYIENKEISYTFYQSNGTYWTKIIEEYDSNKNLIKYELFNTLSKDTEKSYYKYNIQNDVIETKTEKNSYLYNTAKFEYEYDKTENWIEKKFYNNGVLVCIWRREINYYD